ncbi:hypothetical protein [Rhizobium sp. C4]|uniref:hypothetical protein n=1 Tax=Rhizobium sp. C4 TaxID=1349800 RepID=UPI001E32AE9F|nr:hypothetical protein [Rhizobium sp. C4]MCD2176111.1 hypothetical protein [Rhizobium sp. C4]
MSQFVTTTPLHVMRPLGSSAERSFPRIEAMLQREFREQLCFALAEPVKSKDGAGIDWYTELEEIVTPLSALPEAYMDYYRARLEADKATVKAAAQQYEDRSDPAGRTIATALLNAISYPGDEHVYLVGDAQSGEAKLLLTAWGYERHSFELAGSHAIGKREKIFPPAGGVSIDMTAAQETTAETARIAAANALDTPPKRRGWRTGVFYLLWLLAFILPFMVGWMLLPACGIRVPFTDRIVYGWGDGTYCLQVANPQAERGALETQALVADMRRLEDALRDMIERCVSPTAPQPPLTSPAPATPLPTDQNRLQQNGRTLNANEDSVTLTWNNKNDLDLYIVCPDGSLAGIETSACGVDANLDRNKKYTPLTNQPIELLKWPSDTLQPGQYRIQVKYFAQYDQQLRTPFTVTLRRNGQVQIFNKETSSVKDVVPIIEFTVP